MLILKKKKRNVTTVIKKNISHGNIGRSKRTMQRRTVLKRNEDGRHKKSLNLKGHERLLAKKT
jgi:hypothetical protein